LRFKLMNTIRDHPVANGFGSGVSREGLSELNTAQCDGSWLMPKAKETTQCKLA
jgi:hypothetical protein